jgi:alpha-galactosidase
MTQLDEFTYSLLTNDEVIDINQDVLGKQASRIVQYGSLEIWAKDMEDGSKAVGLFNRGLFPSPLTVTWKDLGITGNFVIRDVWMQEDISNSVQKFVATIPAHGVKLLKIYRK